VTIAEVNAVKTQSGNTRFVIRDGEGREYTTFRETIARDAIAAEGRRARVSFHEQQRGRFTNVCMTNDTVHLQGFRMDGTCQCANQVTFPVSRSAPPDRILVSG
jgi:hypothetical protein